MERDPATNLALQVLELNNILSQRDDEILSLQKSLEEEKERRIEVEKEKEKLEDTNRGLMARITDLVEKKNKFRSANYVQQQMNTIKRPLDVGDLNTMGTHIYKCLKADVQVKSNQKRVALTVFGKSIPYSGGATATATVDTAREELVKSLDGRISTLLSEFFSVPVNMAGRKQKLARLDIEHYLVKIKLGYKKGQRDRFKEIASELDRLTDGKLMPHNFLLFKKVFNNLDNAGV